MLRSRRAVGGLISLIGIIIVFAVVATAFIAISESQNNLIRSGTAVGEIQNDRARENIEFTVLSCIPKNQTFAESITFRVNNTSGDTAQLSSMLFFKKSVDGVSSVKLGDAIDADQRISSLESKTFAINDIQTAITDAQGNDIDDSDAVTIVTKLGNKFSLSHDFTSCST